MFNVDLRFLAFIDFPERMDLTPKTEKGAMYGSNNRKIRTRSVA